VLCTGVRANIELVQGSGVATQRGILVDEACRTNIEGIYAAGDVAESYDPLTDHTQVQATWPNAIEQGRVAGANMAGANIHRLRRTRYNVFSVHGLPCASLGVVEATGEGWREEVGQAGERYRKLLFRDGRLAGAVLVGDISEAGALLALIERQVAAGRATAPEGAWATLAQPLNIAL